MTPFVTIPPARVARLVRKLLERGCVLSWEQPGERFRLLADDAVIVIDADNRLSLRGERAAALLPLLGMRVPSIIPS